MARIFTEGFEAGDKLFWDTAPAEALTTTAAEVRSGTYAQIVGSAGAIKYISALSELYVRMGIKNVSLTDNFFRWYATGTQIGALGISTVGGASYITAKVGSTVVATGTIPINGSTYYLVEVYIKIADSGGRIVTKIDGIQDIDYTGDTKPGADTTVNNLRWYGAVGNLRLDDLALNNTSTPGTDDSWCGDGHVIALTPNANGDVSGLTGQDTDSTNNYLNVDEVPADNDTTYNESAVADTYDLYNLTASGLTGVTIKRVWVEARARDTIAAGGTCKVGIKTAGGEHWTAADLALLTTYARILSPEWLTNPEAGGAWSVAQLDALQVGFKART